MRSRKVFIVLIVADNSVYIPVLYAAVQVVSPLVSFHEGIVPVFLHLHSHAQIAGKMRCIPYPVFLAIGEHIARLEHYRIKSEVVPVVATGSTVERYPEELQSSGVDELAYLFHELSLIGTLVVGDSLWVPVEADEFQILGIAIFEAFDQLIHQPLNCSQSVLHGLLRPNPIVVEGKVFASGL